MSCIKIKQEIVLFCSCFEPRYDSNMCICLAYTIHYVYVIYNNTTWIIFPCLLWSNGSKTRGFPTMSVTVILTYLVIAWSAGGIEQTYYIPCCLAPSVKQRFYNVFNARSQYASMNYIKHSEVMQNIAITVCKQEISMHTQIMVTAHRITNYFLKYLIVIKNIICFTLIMLFCSH